MEKAIHKMYLSVLTIISRQASRIFSLQCSAAPCGNNLGFFSKSTRVLDEFSSETNPRAMVLPDKHSLNGKVNSSYNIKYVELFHLLPLKTPQFGPLEEHLR